jgi:hypothetical protein
MWCCQFYLPKNIEEGSSLYKSLSPLLVDQLGRVSESKKDLPLMKNDITIFELELKYEIHSRKMQSGFSAYMLEVSQVSQQIP